MRSGLIEILGLVAFGALIFLANGIDAKKTGKKQTVPSIDPRDLDVLLKHGSESFRINGHEELTLFIGTAKARKQVLLKYVTKDATLKVELQRNGKYTFVDSDQEKATAILPVKYLDPINGDLLVDCPSWDGHRDSPAKDIAASYLTRRVFSAGKMLKIIIVEPDNFLRQSFGKASHLLGTLRSVVDMFQNVEVLWDSLGLVVTNVKTDKSDQDFSKLIKKYLGKVYLHLKNSNNIPVGVLKVLQILNDRSKENVAIQRRPNELTHRGSSPDLKNIRFVLFESLNFTSASDVQFAIKLRPMARTYINQNLLGPSKNLVMKYYHQMAEKLTKKLEHELIDSDLTVEGKSVMLKKRCRRLRKRLRRPKGFVHSMGTLLNLGPDLKYQRFFRDFAYELSKVDFYFTATHTTAIAFYGNMNAALSADIDKRLRNLEESYGFIIHLKHFLASYRIQAKKEELFRRFGIITKKNIADLLTLMRSQGFHFKHAMSLAECAYQDLNVILRNSVYGNFHAEILFGGLFVSGQSLVISKIPIIAKNSRISDNKQIVLTATFKIFVDINIKLRNTHLTLIAPSIEVVGKRYLEMTGENGKNAQGIASKGSNGAAGSPGFSSGNFTLIAYSLAHGSQLNVLHYGGNGGNGQQGGHGENGVDALTITDKDDICHRLNKISSGRNCVWDNWPHKRCDEDFTTTDGAKLSRNGGNGGAGGPGALPGQNYLEVATEKYTSKIATTTPRFGENGRGGAGGQGGEQRCAKKKIYAKGWVKYFNQGSIKSCDFAGAFCLEYHKGKTGLIGATVSRPNAPNFAHKNSPVEDSIRKYFDLVLKNNSNDDQMENRQFSKFLMLNPNLLDMYTLKWFYETAISMFTSTIEIPKLRYMVTEFRGAYRVFRKNKKTEYNQEDLLSLELGIVSELDLLDSTKCKRQVVKIEGALKTLSENSQKILDNWKERYKLDATKSSLDKLNVQATEGEKQSKDFLKNNMEELGSKLQAEVQKILGQVKEQKDEIKKNTEVLQKQKSDLKSNFWKRILLAPFKLLGEITSLFCPAVGAIISEVTNVAENFMIKKHSTDDLEHGQSLGKLKGGVANARQLVLEFQTNQLEGEKAKHQVYIEGIKGALDADRRLGTVFDEKLRTNLVKKQQNLENTGFKLTDDFEDELQDDLRDAQSLMESKQSTDLSTDLKSDSAIVSIAQSIGAVSPEVAHEIMKFKGDSDQIEAIEAQITANRENHEKLQQYEEDVQSTFQPALEGMIKGFESVGNNAAGKSDVMLRFQTFDIRMMIRKCISYIQQFTEGFLEEQAEMIKILGDLELLLVTVMNNYEKVNEIKYKAEFTGLLSKLTTNSCQGRSGTICTLRLEMESIVKTNVLRQEYSLLERAYRQVIFPFVNRQLELLSPSDVIDGRSDVNSIKLKIDTMLDLLKSDTNWITMGVDDKLHVSEFYSNHKTSRPFYTWHQTSHSEQIKKLLSGEPVAFVADVRHRLVRNAVKFDYVTLNITSYEPPAARTIQEMIKYLGVKLVHSGESHYRCHDNYFAINGESLAYEHTFERNTKGDSVSHNKVEGKYRFGDVPYSPYTVWTLQLIDKSQGKGKEKMFELANDWAHKAYVELIGRGSYLEENAAVCNTDLGKHFDQLE